MGDGHAKVWYLQVLDIPSSVCLYREQWHWNEDARVEGIRALVHSFSQFAREIDGGPVRAVHFGQPPPLPFSTTSSRTTTSTSRRYSTSLRQNLLQSRSTSTSNYGTTPAAAGLSISTSSPPSSIGNFHSVSPQSSPNIHSPPHGLKKLEMISKENDSFQVVLFYDIHDDGIVDIAQSLLDKFTAMFAESVEIKEAKLFIHAMVDKDDNIQVLELFERFSSVVLDLVNIDPCDIQVAQV